MVPIFPWPSLRPPVVKRPIEALMFRDRTLCITVVFTPFDRSGLLEQHLKPCLYSGLCRTPTVGVRSMLVLHLSALPFTVLLIALINLAPYAVVSVAVAGKVASQQVPAELLLWKGPTCILVGLLYTMAGTRLSSV